MALSIARVLATMRVIVSLVWVALDVAFSDGFIWYISEDVPAQGRLTIPSSIICVGSFAASRATTGSWSDCIRCPQLPHYSILQ